MKDKTKAIFKTTQWTRVMSAAKAGDCSASAALSELYEAYWPPLYAFLRNRGCSQQDAEDLTQGFFLTLIDKNLLAHAEATRGRFRSFLLTSLKHYWTNQRQAGMALKRGGGKSRLSLDVKVEENRLEIAADGPPAEHIFDRRWAQLVVERALESVRSRYIQRGQNELFQALKRVLTMRRLEIDYKALAKEHNMRPEALKMAAHRLRKRFRQALRDEVAATVQYPEELDDELNYLLSVLGQNPAAPEDLSDKG